MRCFYVLVHGRLTWQTDAPSGNSETDRPTGFYCHRYVLASDAQVARELAFSPVAKNLEKRTGWIGAGLATVEFDAEELIPAPMHNVLKPDDRGHTFY